MRTYSRRGVIAAGAALAASALGPRGFQTARAAGKKGTLHYYNWIDYVHPRTYVAFAKATGFEVKRSYYTSNEALLAKLEGGARGYDLAAPTGYMVATLAEKRLLERIDWKRLPNTKKNIDAKFLGLPYDPKNDWSVPKDWGTTGFMYRTDLVKERPASWAQFFALFKRYPRKFTLLDGPAEVIGSVAVMMGFSFNTDHAHELDKVQRFLIELRPYVQSIDSTTYKSKIIRGQAYGGLGWNGDGLAVVARAPGNAAEYVVPKEGGEFWVDAYVVPKGARNRAAAHAWIDFVYRPKNNAFETAYTYFGSPLERRLLVGVLTPGILANRDVFPSPATMRRLQPSAVSAAGSEARALIWAAFTR